MVDYLLTEETEKRLVEIGWSHFPVRPVEVDESCVEVSDVKTMEVNYEEVYDYLEQTAEELREIFVR
jgi:hypothetical protein